jgi:hypothetical protein
MTARDVAIALDAAWRLAMFWVAVRIFSVDRIEKRLASPRRRRWIATVSPKRLAAIVNRVARVHPLRPRCLERALTTSSLATSCGYRGAVCIGTARTGGQLAAHAWAVVDGAPVDSSAGQYRPLYVLNGD